MGEIKESVNSAKNISSQRKFILTHIKGVPSRINQLKGYIGCVVKETQESYEKILN